MICIGCISITKTASHLQKYTFRLQKLRFVYKYLVISLQSGFSVYKVASRFTIQQILIFPVDIPNLMWYIYHKWYKYITKKYKLFDFVWGFCLGVGGTGALLTIFLEELGVEIAKKLSVNISFLHFMFVYYLIQLAISTYFIYFEKREA